MWWKCEVKDSLGLAQTQLLSCCKYRNEASDFYKRAFCVCVCVCVCVYMRVREKKRQRETEWLSLVKIDSTPRNIIKVRLHKTQLAQNFLAL